MDNIGNAVQLFSQGFNCAQAVLGSFAERAGMDRLTALKVAGGFGAGMGRLQETCGALTGGYMAIGLSKGQSQPGDKETKESCYFMIQEFTEDFISLHGSTNCRVLLGVDLQTEEGKKRFLDEKMHTCKCEKFVATAVKQLESLI